MRRLLVLAAFAVAVLAHAAPELGGLTERSQANFRFLGMSIYNIRLWSAEPVTAERWAEQKLALELEYTRALKGSEIASRSLKEMRRQANVTDAQAKAWLTEMEAAFPDVKAGDRISGVLEPGAGAQFFVNGKPSRHVQDTEFAKLFFGIWLSPKTSEPALRDKLLGGGDASKR